MLQFLASELIFEIFRHFLPGLQLSVTELDLFPWYLGQTCSLWRSIFISSPQFWSNIKIDMDAHRRISITNQNSIPVIELVKLALERSNDHPLSIFIAMRTVFAHSSSLAMCSIETLKILVSHSMRWKYLCVDISPSYYSTLSGAKGRLPILRSLKITGEEVPCPDIFMGVTQLTRISLTRTCLTDSRINLSSVTELHLVDKFTLDEAIFIIRETSLLEKLVIAVPDWDMLSDWSTSVTVHLPSLKELYITTLIPLKVLRTPRLEVLQFGLYRGRIEPFFNNPGRELLVAILSDYFCNVHNFKKLEIFRSNTEYALLIFEAAPISIQELKLHHDFISGQLPLVARCPNLYNIKAISVVTNEDDLSLMWAMVSTWVRPLEHLVQFSLEVDRVANCNVPGVQQALKWLKKLLEEQGIKFDSRIAAEQEIRDPDISFESEW